jgi:uncharacterized protein DUF3574
VSGPRVLALVALLAGPGCAGPRVAAPSPSAALCAVGDTALVRDLVYFGRNRPDGGTVSDAEWLAFLDSVVTPSFPSGFTVVEGTGQWKGQAGAVERERSAIITFLHTGQRGRPRPSGPGGRRVQAPVPSGSGAAGAQPRLRPLRVAA